MSDLNTSKKQLLFQCKEDHVGLWFTIGYIEDVLPGAKPTEIQQATLKLVQDLLESGLIQAGFPTPDGKSFEPWSLSPEETVARILSEWDALGREPTIGEIVWFTTTEKGDEEIEKLTAYR